MSKEASHSPSGSDQGLARPVLFDIPTPPEPVPPAGCGTPRVQRADRHQVRMQMSSLDALLEEDHQARVVWEYVEGLDLTCLYEAIRAVEGRPGAEPIDPRILMALWLYATLDGVGAARQVNRLCKDHVAYQWICGGVSVNYHTLSDFRTANVELLDRLLTQSVAGLMREGLVTMNRVAQDGMRVRANAGTSSFRRGQTLDRLEEEARQQVEALRKELQDDPGAATKRQQAARERARRERLERIARARKELAKVEQTRPPDKKDKARASTTDPEARFMKMPDGGMRPAVNVQLATDTDSRIITGVDVSNVGSDKGQMGPMLDQHRDRYGQPPPEAAGGRRVRQPGRHRCRQRGRAAHGGVCPGAEVAKGRREELLRASAAGHRGGGPVASADGHAGGPGDLQGTGLDGRMDQRHGAESRDAALPGPRSAEDQGGGAVVRLGGQPGSRGHSAPAGGRGNGIGSKKEKNCPERGPG